MLHVIEAHVSPASCSDDCEIRHAQHDAFRVPRLLVCANRDITVPAHDILVYVT